jgi:hypothetical protein
MDEVLEQIRELGRDYPPQIALDLNLDFTACCTRRPGTRGWTGPGSRSGVTG